MASLRSWIGPLRIALTKPDTVVSTNSNNVVTTNLIHITVDDVTYGTGGRWGQWSDGGGSSLELIDAHSDDRLASNWADSEEAAKAPWTVVEVTGVLDNGNSAADSLQVFLLGPGECLVDNIEVIPAGSTANLVPNPNFETGLTNWVFQGIYDTSSWETNSGYLSSRSLHVRAPFSELVEVPHGLDFVRRDDLRDLLRAVAGPIGRPSGDGAVLVGSQGLGQRVVRSIERAVYSLET